MLSGDGSVGMPDEEDLLPSGSVEGPQHQLASVLNEVGLRNDVHVGRHAPIVAGCQEGRVVHQPIVLEGGEERLVERRAGRVAVVLQLHAHSGLLRKSTGAGVVVEGQQIGHAGKVESILYGVGLKVKKIGTGRRTRGLAGLVLDGHFEHGQAISREENDRMLGAANEGGQGAGAREQSEEHESA
jgi:hypothetical protein